MLAEPGVGHLHHQMQPYDPASQGVHHLRLRVWFVCGLGVLVLALKWQTSHVSLDDQIAHSTWSFADTQESSGPMQRVPLWSTQLEKRTSQEMDM